MRNYHTGVRSIPNLEAGNETSFSSVFNILLNTPITKIISNDKSRSPCHKSPKVLKKPKGGPFTSP